MRQCGSSRNLPQNKLQFQLVRVAWYDLQGEPKEPHDRCGCLHSDVAGSQELGQGLYPGGLNPRATA